MWQESSCYDSHHWSDQRDNILAMPNVDLMYSFVIFFRHLETVFCMKGWTSWFLATVPTFDCMIFAGVCFCSSYTVHRYMPLHTKHSGTQETRDHPHVEIITELSGCCKLYQFTVNSTYVSSLLAPFTPIQCHQEEEKLRQFLPLPKSIFLYLCDWRLGIKNRNENRSSCWRWATLKKLPLLLDLQFVIMPVY